MWQEEKVLVAAHSMMMLRVTRQLLKGDKTMAPHKYYRYGYMPDPRKILPMETISDAEVKPRTVRPPHTRVPNVEAFLQALEWNEKQPVAEFKSSFTSWNDLMTATPETMRARGIPGGTANYIWAMCDMYRCGVVPSYYNMVEERQYWRQFHNKDGAHRVIPELPEKYRPHQLGEDQQPVPEYEKINLMPEWAVKEEERLAAKLAVSSKKAQGTPQQQ